MKAHVGTSGYAFKEWKGAFYPADLADSAMLSFYASQLDAVEINNTFYRIPKESVVAGWAAGVPEGFRLCLKASQRITHHARLKEADDLVRYFLQVSTALGEKRGPTLFQLPPNLKKDTARLEAFLDTLPKRWAATIEFRHPSWFADDVHELLRARNVALCIIHQDDFEAPLVATASWGYVRLHRPAYSRGEIDAWAGRLAAMPWEETYVFFKHDYADLGGPPAALALKETMGR
jgi:uncharacterized protein YecE (DUF72 family)